MHPSNIVRVGVVCTALFVGACGFSPGKPVSGAGGAGNTVVTGIGNFGGASSDSIQVSTILTSSRAPVARDDGAKSRRVVSSAWP